MLMIMTFVDLLYMITEAWKRPNAGSGKEKSFVYVYVDILSDTDDSSQTRGGVLVAQCIRGHVMRDTILRNITNVLLAHNKNKAIIQK
jgi:hypothetical protein